MVNMHNSLSMRFYIIFYFKDNCQGYDRKTYNWQIVTLDCIVSEVYQLYACITESMNFINRQALSNTLTALMCYSFGPLGL